MKFFRDRELRRIPFEFGAITRPADQALAASTNPRHSSARAPGPEKN